MPSDLLDSLRQIAEAARAAIRSDVPWFGDAIGPVNQWTVLEPDARFIAAFPPPLVLALLDVVEVAIALERLTELDHSYAGCDKRDDGVERGCTACIFSAALSHLTSLLQESTDA